jgi:hypothetical protein
VAAWADRGVGPSVAGRVETREARSGLIDGGYGSIRKWYLC